jgi:hypothetical protein
MRVVVTGHAPFIAPAPAEHGDHADQPQQSADYKSGFCFASHITFIVIISHLLHPPLNFVTTTTTFETRMSRIALDYTDFSAIPSPNSAGAVG